MAAAALSWRVAAGIGLLASWLGAVHAGTLSAAARHTLTDYCSRTPTLTATQQDRILRFADVARRELETAGRPLAIVSRSGLDLGRFGQRYSHAGISLADGAGLRWAVRQLYYACEEGRPRLYDQGLAGFALGTDDPDIGYLSLVLLPPGTALEALRAAAADEMRALSLLGGRYSANAYAFGTRYQNCNQWLAELLGSAWAGVGDVAADKPPRERARDALRQLGYVPEPLAAGSPLVLALARWAPLIHLDDHPEEDLRALTLQVSMPASIEAFVRRRLPDSERIELCHADGRIVVRRGWTALPDGCRPAAGDELIELD